MKIYLNTLGCDKNTVDAQQMLGSLSGAGYEIVDQPEGADVIIVNTCCFIDAAKEESIDTILALAETKKLGTETKLFVTGCMAERYTAELRAEIPEIDGFLGVGHIDEVVDFVNRGLASEQPVVTGDIDRPYHEDMERYLTPGAATAYLKISEGCDHHCTYCVIPNIRGKHRSRRPEAILAEAKKLAESGVKELILIAQDTTQYGNDLAEEINLAGLLKQLEAQGGFTWIRLLYMYPEGISEELLSVMAESKVICHYFDLPIQHTEDAILKRMGRQIDKASLYEKIAAIRQAMPDAVLRTAIITGFPGETEEDHAGLLASLAELRFDRLGAFKYSQEEGTPAAEMADQIPAETKERRWHEIYTQQQGITAAANRSFVGKTHPVLIDEVGEEGVCEGRMYSDAPEIDCAVIMEDATLKKGAFYDILITDSFDYDLIGEKNESA